MQNNRGGVKCKQVVEEKAFIRDRGTKYGKTYRKTYCPNCFTRLSDNIIRLRDGLYQCRRCNAIWTRD